MEVFIQLFVCLYSFFHLALNLLTWYGYSFILFFFCCVLSSNFVDSHLITFLLLFILLFSGCSFLLWIVIVRWFQLGVFKKGLFCNRIIFAWGLSTSQEWILKWFWRTVINNFENHVGAENIWMNELRWVLCFIWLKKQQASSISKMLC